MSGIRKFPRRLALAAALALGLAALGPGVTSAFASHSAGEVYTLTNSPAGNAVKAFDRRAQRLVDSRRRPSPRAAPARVAVWATRMPSCSTETWCSR